uniref:Transcription factor E2FA isoform X1 n=1 Tax=Rhizophora mucronata TaxID=61149 RepID=A0A2P2J3J1_RHIMU
MGPIDVYLVSQFEENFEEMNGVKPSASFSHTSCSNSKENPTDMVAAEAIRKECQAQQANYMVSDLDASQEFVGGMMKIVPSDIDNDADYWLLSDADFSITDMWKTDSNTEWNGMNAFPGDFEMNDVHTPRPQPPSEISQVPSGVGSSTQR